MIFTTPPNNNFAGAIRCTYVDSTTRSLPDVADSSCKFLACPLGVDVCCPQSCVHVFASTDPGFTESRGCFGVLGVAHRPTLICVPELMAG